MAALVGHYLRDYRRTESLRSALDALGYDVVDVHDGASGLLRRYRGLARAARRVRPDLVVVPFPGTSDVPFAAWWARRARVGLVYDAYISQYDSLVSDRRRFGRWSRQALALWLLDRTAAEMADVVLLDTAAHVDYFVRTFRLRRPRFAVVPVGYGAPLLPPRPPSGRPLRVVFYGTYLPLHGADVVVEALARVRAARPDVELTMIGEGQTRPSVEEQARVLGVEARFLDTLAAKDLHRELAAADVSLGIFGTTDKAARVVPNKVFDGLASGVAVVTRDSPALREFFEPGRDLTVVPAGDPVALSECLLDLADRPDRRHALAEGGWRRVQEVAGPRTVEAALADALWRAGAPEPQSLERSAPSTAAAVARSQASPHTESGSR